MLNELFTRMQYEPSLLLHGKNFRTLDTAVIDYAWNAVVTTNCDLELAASFSNGKRTVRDIYEKNNMQANLLDRKKLHIIRLFGEHYPDDGIDELDKEDITDKATSMLERISEIIKRNGILLVEDFEEPLFSHKEMRKAFKSLYSNQKQIYIFNCKNTDQYLEDLRRQGIAVLIEESISDFFSEYISDETNEQETSDNSIYFYVEAEKSMKVSSIEKRQLLETESFATLLNIDLLNEVKIPQAMFNDYFNLFLKNSVREPQWFGYSYGFNLHRDFEDQLYRKVKKGLENVGKQNNKPLLIVGQTGTGKSIALAAIAHKIFNEKKYPVIYINDPEVNFRSSVEYRQKGVNRKGAPAFNALDSLIEKLENLGAKATLLLWDTSSYSTGREKCYRLYQALLARGRKVYLVSTAYELNSEEINIDLQEEYVEESVLNKKFEECYAKVEMTGEYGQLKDILVGKCNLSEQSVNTLMDYYVNDNSNFLSMLYQMFEILRGDLAKGVYKEASKSLQELDKMLENCTDNTAFNNVFLLALKKVEGDLVASGIVEHIDDVSDVEKQRIEVAKDDFIKSVAICSQFKIKMPYDYALRILGTYNVKIIRILAKSTFFVITQDYYGNYEISLRTPLEASMYLSAKKMTSLDEIESIIMMLEHMNPSGGYGQQKEVRICEKLIRLIGPNNHQNRNKYKKGYPEVIKALKNLRVERNIWEPILVSQEITYLRECFGNDDSRPMQDRISALKEAVSIADEVLNRFEYEGISMGTRGAIVVESANSKLLLCQLQEINDKLLFKELRRDLKNVIRLDSLNYHAYVTLLKGSIIEYRNETDKIKKLELLEAMCSIADEIMFENPDVANSEFFQRQVADIYSLLDETETLRAYIDELVANGSSAGLYVIARKQLLDNGVDFKKSIVNEMQESACQNVYELFNEEKYKSVLSESESCQYMLLNVVWLMNNKQPIYMEGECWLTKMSEDAWREIFNICNNFIARFCNSADEFHQIGKNVRYIKALCLGQLGQYRDSLSELNHIAEDSSLGLRRVVTKHILCKEDGTPCKFTGRLGKYDEVNRSGAIYIEEFGRNPIYYHGPHLKTSDLGEGNVFNDIEIGYNNIAPKAFRGIENKE